LAKVVLYLCSRFLISEVSDVNDIRMFSVMMENWNYIGSAYHPISLNWKEWKSDWRDIRRISWLRRNCIQMSI